MIMLEIKRQLRYLRCLPAASSIRIRDLHSIETFLECIKTKNVELSLLALEGLELIVKHTKLDPRSLQAITETVTKITEFTTTDSELVEEGYRRAVSLCRCLVECQTSHELTNVCISEIIILCFRVFNWKRASLTLRDYTTRELTTITRLIFGRLTEFPDDPTLKPSYQIRLRLGGTSSQSTFKELTDQFSSATDNSGPTSLRIINERNHHYNLAFVNDFFCYLASLINIDQESESSKMGDERINLGLKLIKTAFVEAGKNVGAKSCLLYTTRNNICYNLVSILKTNRKNVILSKALNLAVDIFLNLRAQLKYQFEGFLERLMEMVATKADETPDTAQPINPNLELRYYVLSSILDMFTVIDHLPHELYYNFDCDPYSSNIYENMIQICSKNCFVSQNTEFTAVQLTAFESLLANLTSMHNVELDPRMCFVAAIVDVCKPPNCHFPGTYTDLIEAKRRKRTLWQAIEKFNASPKKGMEFIKEQKLIDTNEQLVHVLKDNLRVDKKILGEFLAKEENKPLRECFIGSLNFTNLRLDEALRFMLEKFRLPGESQLIERILDTFSAHWFNQNPSVLQNADNAMSLAYAIIMLNVDQHSKEVKKNSKPMTEDEFDRNLLGPKRERIYERQLLDQIFANIRDNEIVLPDEQVGTIRQRYLWKCTMVRSEREEALYWTTGDSSMMASDSGSGGRGIMNDGNNSCNNSNNNIETGNINRSNSGVAKIPDATIVEIGDLCLHDYVHGGPEHNNNISNLNNNGKIVLNKLNLIDANALLFEIMWSPTIAALSFIFDKIEPSLYPDLSIQIVDLGFTRIAHLCAKHGHLDNLVTSLCKFSSDLSPILHNHSGQRPVMISDKNSLAARSLLSIIRDHGDRIRDSWTHIIRNLLQWFCSRSMDDLLQVDDFALQHKFCLRMREVKKSPSTMNQQSSTFLRSVLTYFASLPEKEESGRLTAETNGDQNGDKKTTAFSVLLKSIQDSEYNQESLCELIGALVTTTLDGDPEEIEDCEVFKLEIFTQVILNNKSQAELIWTKIRSYYVRLASICGRSAWLGERIISSAFRVAIQLKPKPEVFSLLGHLIQTLEPELIRAGHTFVALTSLTELQSANEATMDARELDCCFNQVIFPFLDKLLEGCERSNLDPVKLDPTLNRAINLACKIFLKHLKLLKELATFATLLYAILDIMDKYMKTNEALKEAIFELIRNMIFVMDNEHCMSVEMKDFTRTKLMFWGFHSSSDYQL